MFNISFFLIFLIFLNTIGIEILYYFFKDWLNLSIYINILSFLFFAKVTYNPISDILVVLNKNHVTLIFNIYQLLISSLAIYIGFIKNNILTTINMISFIGGVGYLFITLYILYYLRKISRA